MPGARVLCVDRSHDGRGIFAQAYLELLRIWLANTTSSRNWVCKDISSMGLMDASPFSSKHADRFPKNSLAYSNQSRSNAVLRAFAADRKSFAGAEKDEVLARVANRQMRGLRAEDFREREFIVCFEKETHALLTVLRAMASADAHGADMPAKIHYISIGHDLTKHDQMRTAKKELRKWATLNLGWKTPEVSHDVGKWNTKQVVVPEACYYALLRDHERRLEKIKQLTGCDYHFSTPTSGSTRVVSITGRNDKLQLAAKKVRDDAASIIPSRMKTNFNIGDMFMVSKFVMPNF